MTSLNTHGPTKFVGPDSMDVKIEGKNVQLLGDPMLNNCGPGGSPANSATMEGIVHSPLPPGSPRPGDKPEICPKDGGDHDWREESSESVADGNKKNAQLADSVKNPEVARGYKFENDATDHNLKDMDIQKVGVEYRCQKCGQDQEVDIVGKDQIAEAKSRKAKQVKKKGKQARRIRDIQQKCFNKNKNPRSKLDGSLNDVEESKKKYLERGFDVEVVV